MMMRALRRTARPCGLTVIELITLMVLLVIVAAFAIPGMSPVVLHLRLRGAAWQVAGDLRLARQRAVTVRKRYRLCLPPTTCALDLSRGPAYSVERDDGTSSPNWVNDTGGAASRLPPDVQINATAIPVFAATGSAAGSTFTLTNPLGSYQVAVSPTGRVRVCEGSCQ
jgi:Tfp pilus assembly protein FimT